MSVLVEISCLFLLVVANGYLSMSEMAIVVAKKAHLRIRAKDGDKKAEAALALATSPGEFLAAIQLGITGIGILAGVFSGATLTA
ncbi:MAG: CNNM domain-containing protein, partial [Candidatus Obscuribacterales bacterium]|nr:CNNM domain-containing protein [Candidatus Obscuribacterales bacterium]